MIRKLIAPLCISQQLHAISRRFFGLLCVLTLLGAGAALAAAADPGPYLVIDVSAAGADVRVHARLGSESAEVNLKGERKAVLERVERLYTILQDKKTKELPALRADVAALSAKMAAPFAALYAKTDHVVYRIDKHFVRAPLDLLEVNAKPIFLTHAVTYVVTKFELGKKPFPEIEEGYLMADLSCDPELGLQAVAKTIPNAKYAKMENASLASIKKSAKDTNVLVISAHGGVDDENAGEVAINKEELDADFVKHLSVDLTYFDSCQMGAAWDFVQEFAKHQTSTYYTAPIISNDAGDSSTRTVTWFFEGLRGGKAPAQAMAETRRKLYDYYQKKKLNEIVVLNKAFPFRVYEFDQD